MKKLLTLLIICITINANADSWVQKASFPLGLYRPVSFTIGNRGYVGCGIDINGDFSNALWEYDPLANTWTQKANYDSIGDYGMCGFSIGNKGYAGSAGISPFSEYDASTNIWTHKANFPGGKIRHGVGFSIGNSGYMGIGINFSVGLLNDLWQYNPITNIWLQKTTLPGALRSNSSCFVIGNNSYVIAGWDVYTQNGYTDLWEYNSVLNSWTQKANLPSANNERSDAAAFAICDKGYCGLGDSPSGFYNDFWQYDPASNTWIQKTSFPGAIRDETAHFSIGSKGYIGLGENLFIGLYNDFYEYTPDSACATGIADIAAVHFDFNIYPNPAKNEFAVSSGQWAVGSTVEIKIFDTEGKIVLSKSIVNNNSKLLTVNCKQFPAGIYYVQVSEGENKVARKVVVE